MKRYILGIACACAMNFGVAQVPVFKCEVDGRVSWSDQPCKGKGKVVNVKPVQGKVRQTTNAKSNSPAPVNNKSEAK